MAVKSHKFSKEKRGKSSKALPQSESKPGQISRREKQARRVSIFLKQVNSPIRLQVILILADGERNVGALCDQLGHGQPVVSHHLALLRHGGIIAPRRQGKNNFYSLTKIGTDLANLIKGLLHEGAAEQLPVTKEKPKEFQSRTIELTPGVCGGSARVSGTRIPVWVLVEARDLGASDAQLLRDYPTLKAVNLEDAWDYAKRHREEIAAEIHRNQVA